MDNDILKTDEDSFILDIDGFEGPIELLLDLSRNQKVDLNNISILELADQYNEYVRKEIKVKNLTLVADYLVIAALLTYLKSKLLLPSNKKEEISANLLAENLKEQLIKLNALRKAGNEILTRPQLNKDFYKNGVDKNTQINKKYVFDCNLHDLLSNIVSINARQEIKKFKLNLKHLHTVDEALKNLKTFFEKNDVDWILLDKFVSKKNQDPIVNKSNIAANFAASLELAKVGFLQIRQHELFAPIYIKNIINKK